MAKKRIDIDLGVNTSELDQAAQKVGELRKLSDNLSIQYDIDGKPLDLVINKSLNLQKQVRVLTAELRKTKEGTAEFKLLSTALGDAQDGLARTNAKSRDLLASLQLIPGPVGEFASQLNGVIGLLKTFSSFSLKDLRFQFTETINDFKDIYKNFTGVNQVTQEVIDSNDGLTRSLGEVAGESAATTTNINKQTKALAENQKASYLVVDADGKVVDAYKNAANAADIKNQAIANGTITTKGAVKATTELAVANEGLVVAEKAATFWTTTLGNTIKTVLISTGILAAVVAIGSLVSWLYELATAESDAEKKTKSLKDAFVKNADAAGEAKNKVEQVGVAFAEARKKTISKKEALDEYNKVLGGTIGEAKTLEEAETLYNANTANYIKATGLRAEAQELYALAAKKSTEALTAEEVGFWSFDRGLFQTYDAELKERKSKLNATADEFRKKGNELTAEALKLEKNYKPKEEKTATKTGKTAEQIAEDEYNRLLKELDAKIQLEVDKENTSQKLLQGLLDKRRVMVTKHDKLTYSEVELMRQQNSKKVKDALDEDTKRIQAYQSKVDDIRIAAIEDEEQRQLEARSKKLYDDKVALSYDLEFQKRSKEEQDRILKQMEETTAMDLLKIRDGHYMKKFQKDEEAFLKEMELQTRVKEFELTNGQTRLDQANDFNTLYGDYIFGNKGLKAQWEKYFVDLRQVYADEFVNTETRLELEKEQLQKDFDEKKLTRESYESQITQINDRIIANRERNTQRQLDLDKLEIDSKRANADMTIQVGERLVGALTAIAGKNKKIQKAAALVEAGVAIARIVTDTSRAIIAFSASVAPLGPAGIPIAAAYAVKAKIAGALGIATIIAQGIGKLKSIDDSDSGGTEGGGGQQGNGLGRGYAQGGLIKGRRHAQGGTLIEAEDGEAVMTRGAVTMFAPLLSAMNQMGGGTSFSNMNVVRPDNPVLNNPAQEQAPLIVKTYVVENELSSTQAKQARLKDLSTL